MSSPSKSDPVPTNIIKQCLNVFVPIITKMINLSLSEGTVPSNMKRALVTPILKKSTLDREALGNYRPVSNLSYVSKLAEKIVVDNL